MKTLKVQALIMQGLTETDLNGSKENICNHSQIVLKTVVQPPNSTCFIPFFLLSIAFLSLGNLKEPSLLSQWSQHKSRLVGEHLQFSKRTKKSST